MKKIAGVVVTVALSMFAACGADDQGSSRSSPETVDDSSSPDSAATGTEGGGRSLALSDLPQGWSESPDGGTGMTALACLHYLASPPVKALTESDMSRTFVSGAGMPMLNQTVVQFATPADATEVMDLLEDEVRNCSTLRGADAPPGPMPGPMGGSFRPIAIGDIPAADRTSGWEMDAEAGAGIPLSAVVVVSQRGKFLSALLTVSVGTNDIGDLEGLASVAVSRLA